MLSDGVAEVDDATIEFEIGERGTRWSRKAVATFAVEGFGYGNNYKWYVAVFESRWTDRRSFHARPLPLVAFMPVASVGLGRLPVNSWMHVDGSDIVLSVHEYSPHDSECCPSLPAVIRLELTADSKLIEVTK
jgi:hypothetical protein